MVEAEVLQQRRPQGALDPVPAVQVLAGLLPQAVQQIRLESRPPGQFPASASSGGSGAVARSAGASSTRSASRAASICSMHWLSR